ncbi:MAG: hypothetical protein KTR30_32720 [Saprospiraceae bacterium]|nr:hypothetical protein [Saprospiraceae bacterium]
MKANELFRLVRKNAWLIILTGLLAATAVYFLTVDSKQKYTSKAVLSTGAISAISINDPAATNRVDRDYFQNEMEKLISLATGYETMEELASRLMAKYLMLNGPDRKWVSAENLADIRAMIPDQVRRQIVVDTSEEATYQNLVAMREAAEPNAIQDIIYSDEEYFGIEYLQGELKVYRRGNSDLIQFIYSTTDPAICQQSLNYLIDIFMGKHADLKKVQSSDVVDYFASATQESSEHLKQAEQQLLNFRISNKIINYNEQTKAITFQKEELDEVFFTENMKLQSTQATLNSLEEQLGNRARLAKLRDGLLQQRQELSEVTQQLAKYEIMSGEAKDMEEYNQEVPKLLERQQELKKEITTYAQEAFKFDQTPDGIETKNLLDQWLRTMVEREESQARLAVIQNRQGEFEEIYGKFAPWGSQLTKIEREIQLAEDAYLENLHSYNQAMLHMQNTLMATNLKVLDAPYFPLEKGDSRRLLLMILGFLGGIFTTLSLLIARGYMDERLKSPDAVSEVTGLSTSGVLPDFSMVKGSKRNESLAKQSLALLLQQVKLETLAKQEKPKMIYIGSTREGEGKSLISTQVVAGLRAGNSRVLHLFPFEDGQDNTHPDNHAYRVNAELSNKTSIEQLIWENPGGEAGLADFDYVVMDSPAMLTGQYPVGLINQFDLVLLACRANRAWEAGDQKAIESLAIAADCPIKVVLNGAHRDVIRDFVGNSTGRRSQAIQEEGIAAYPILTDR